MPEAFEGIVYPHSVAPLHPDEIEAIAAINGVEDVAESLFFWSFEDEGFVVGLGFDPSVDFGPGRLKAGLVEGRYLRPTSTCRSLTPGRWWRWPPTFPPSTTCVQQVG